MTPPPPNDRIKEILDLALERPPRDRAAFISGMCSGDSEMAHEVHSLLAALDAVGTLLEPRLPSPPTVPPPVPLTGLSFGSYRVGQRLGAGGMGIVYRAEDVRLGRAVAVKTLPPHLAADPHLRSRFEHEARVLASLNHPNIEAIYGVEDTVRGAVLVLEYVPGESIASRLSRGPMAWEDALPIACQILRALESAHAAGVVHRDLKPANVHILPDGVAKVLDFGVARLEGPRPVESPPASLHGPPAIDSGQVGVFGTASYMSPEQARGMTVDRRADMWAFGCLLYEMLAGKQCFQGETFADTLAAVLQAEPDWSRIARVAPLRAQRLLRRCLARDLDRRQRDAGDARVELELPDVAESRAVSLPAPRSRLVIALAFASGVSLVAAAGYFWPAPWSRTRSTPAGRSLQPVRFSLQVPADLAVSSHTPVLMAVSPDGTTLVYAAGGEKGQRLIKRSLASPEWTELPGTRGAITPFFSPDSAWIGFVADHQLKRVPVRGGGAEILVAEGVGNNGCSWSAQRIVYSNTHLGLSLFEFGSALTRVLVEAEDPSSGKTVYAHPDFLADADTVLFTVCTDTTGVFDGHIESVRIATGVRKIIYSMACCPRFVRGPEEPGSFRGATAAGKLMFWQAGSLLVAPFDPADLRVTGSALPITPLAVQVERIPMMRFAVARDASVLATVPGNVSFDPVRLAWLDPAGKASIITKALPAIDTPRLSPDGARIAFVSGGAGNGELWIYDLTRGTQVLLPGTLDSQHPLWSPDGRYIAFATTPKNGEVSIRRIPTDQSSPADTIWSAPASWSAYPSSFTPSGTTLLITAFNEGDPQSQDLYTLDLPSRGPPQAILPAGSVRVWPRLSPDGSLLAYTAIEHDRFQVYLHSYPSLLNKIPVSVGGGYRPTWSADGRTLYYQWKNSIFAVDIKTADPLTISEPRTVLHPAPDLRYDIGHDGRILMPYPEGEWGIEDTVDVTLGWEALLEHAAEHR